MKNHFREYDEVCDKIEELNYKKLILKENLYSISGINYDKLPSTSSSNGDALVYKIQEIDDLNEEIDMLTLKKSQLFATHEAEICRLENDKERKVLRCYYLLRMKMGDIAEMMQITENHAYKLRKSATANFLEMIKNDRK